MLEIIKETFITRVWGVGLRINTKAEDTGSSHGLAQFPRLWDLIHVDLRWGWCNNNRNKVHNKCDVLESSWNQPCSPTSVKKLSFTKAVPGTKKVRVCWDWKCEPRCRGWFKSLGWPVSQGGTGHLIESLTKDPDAGKDWGQEKKGVTEDEMDGITDLMDMSLSQLQKMVKTREAWYASVIGVTESDRTEQLNNSHSLGQKNLPQWVPAFLSMIFFFKFQGLPCNCCHTFEYKNS